MLQRNVNGTLQEVPDASAYNYMRLQAMVLTIRVSCLLSMKRREKTLGAPVSQVFCKVEGKKLTASWAPM